MVISSGFGGNTGVGPVTVSIVFPGVCFPLGGPPLAGAAPFFPGAGADFYNYQRNIFINVHHSFSCYWD